VISFDSTVPAESEDRPLSQATVLTPPVEMTQADYEALALFRYEMRRFMGFSKEFLDAEGVSSVQYQAMLAIKARAQPMTIGELAKELFIKIQTAVELVDRLQDAGLVERSHSPEDRRRILLSLTAKAEDILPRLAAGHLANHRAKAASFAKAIARFQKSRAI
jgi:DNA-binding MarR family transcriptional regulator